MNVPPQNIEAEESVLGAMLVAEPALTRVIDEVKLNAADFYLDRHRLIFEAVHDLYAASKPVDELSVAEALTQRNRIEEAGGKHYVSELAAKVPAAGNAKHYAEIVQRHAVTRRRIDAGRRLTAPDLDPEQADGLLAELQGLLTAEASAVGRGLLLTPYSAISPERVRWAWEGRIPLGSLTILAGRQGLGKSTLLALLAAGWSCGTLPGDLHSRPSTVLTASYEDAAPQVAARLLAAGADAGRVLEIAAAEDGQPDLLSLPADIELLRPLIEEHRPAALLIDPLMAALPGRVDSHRDQDVRRALAPLAQLAEETAMAIVAVLHLRKGAATESLDRISGSVAFTAAARSVLAFGEREQDDDEADDTGRVLAHAKSNLGPLAPSLAYSIEGAAIEHSGEAVETSRLRPDGEVDVLAGELLSPPPPEDRTEVDIAADWLADHLADGEWHPTADVRDAARAADIAVRTLQRAAKRLGLEAERQGFPALGHWRMPTVAPDGLAPLSRQTGWRDSEYGSVEPNASCSETQSRQDTLSGATASAGGGS